MEISLGCVTSVTISKIPHQTSTVKNHVTVSIGLTLAYPAQHVTPEQLIKKADEALYEEKENGRNRSVYKKLHDY